MANNCRAKDPNSCRVHGNGGTLDQLQKAADTAAIQHDIQKYLSIRAQMESLTDEQPSGFTPPYRDNNNLETWKDQSGNILADTPTELLVTNLYRSASRDLPDTDKVTDLLRIRRYEDQDLLLAKHFGFGKDSNHSTNAVTARKLSRLTDEIETTNKVRFPPSNKEAFIRRYFDLSNYTHTATREHCKKFVEDYKTFLTQAK